MTDARVPRLVEFIASDHDPEQGQNGVLDSQIAPA
jgi:hypothetical protein